VCDRARALRQQGGTLGGYALDGQNAERAVTINLLDDAAVLEPGEDAVWSELICERLAELRPGVHDGWTADALARALKPLGVTTGQIGRRFDGEVVNRRVITTAELAAARRARQLPGPDSTTPANG
jgi:DNA segregation ATPase FtsK/SpoIIIE, S-DNA-T family